MGEDMLSVANAVVEDAAPDEIDEITLRRAATGERAASRALVERYQQRVFALASRMLAGRGRATVEDVAQDTFLAVFRRLATFEPAGPAKLSTWILKICARRAIDELRRQRPAPLGELGLDKIAIGGPRADEATSRREVIAAIEAALADLSPELRAAFLLREYHDLEYAEIAKALDIDLGTVKSRLSRARVALRASLAEARHG
jgi:RNA polymerase sigma-70 factor (ECF subfamily)